MTVEFFSKLLGENNAILLNDNLILFNDYELYSFDNQESKQYIDIDALVDDNEEIKEIILKSDDFIIELDGGRGSDSGGMEGGFNHSPEGRGNGKPKTLLNAELNFGTSKGNSISLVLGRFQKKYGKSYVEYGVAVDSNGYVHEHIRGGASSVPVRGGKGLTIIHNHPSGGNFSDTDLLMAASTKNKGIIATSSNPKKKSTYRFEKTHKFKEKSFIKAVKKARWPRNMSYSKGADWWLKKNAKVYGYKYTSSGVPNK